MGPAAAAGFAAISGSATVTLLAVGAIMYQALLENGYSKTFAIGVISASASNSEMPVSKNDL